MSRVQGTSLDAERFSGPAGLQVELGSCFRCKLRLLDVLAKRAPVHASESFAFKLGQFKHLSCFHAPATDTAVCVPVF